MSHFEIVVISAPSFIQDEAELICNLFQAGLKHFHIRKREEPISDKTYRLIDTIPLAYHKNLVWHASNGLLKPNSITKEHTSSFKTNENKTWHSLGIKSPEEVSLIPDETAYTLCSPVFNSVSKPGYSANKAWESCPQSSANLYALGGVTDKNIVALKQHNWKGAAVLGHIWGKPKEAIKRFKTLQELVNG